MLGLPKAMPRFLKNTSWKPSVLDHRVPWGPYLSLVAASLPAAKSNASSQETGFHLPSPRAPARISGCLSRSGS